jgi:hypothetical protein
MDSYVSPKDETWFVRVRHHISNEVYLRPQENGRFPRRFGTVMYAFVHSSMHSTCAVSVCIIKANAIGCLTYRKTQIFMWRVRQPTPSTPISAPPPTVDPFFHNVRTRHTFMKNAPYLTGLPHPGDMFVPQPMKSTQRAFSSFSTE